MKRPSRSAAASRGRQRNGGFTLLEVMIAVLLAMVGLVGTVAVQQALLQAAQNANDVTVAVRLASQRMEELQVARTHPGPPVIDELAARAAETGTKWSTPEYLDFNGSCATGTSAATPACRWERRWKVTDAGEGRPYDLSVEVIYRLDTGRPKAVRIDAERRKNF